MDVDVGRFCHFRRFGMTFDCFEDSGDVEVNAWLVNCVCYFKQNVSVEVSRLWCNLGSVINFHLFDLVKVSRSTTSECDHLLHVFFAVPRCPDCILEVLPQARCLLV